MVCHLTYHILSQRMTLKVINFVLLHFHPVSFSPGAHIMALCRSSLLSTYLERSPGSQNRRSGAGLFTSYKPTKFWSTHWVQSSYSNTLMFDQVWLQVVRPFNYRFLKSYLSTFVGDLPTKLETRVSDWDWQFLSDDFGFKTLNQQFFIINID